MDERAEFLEWVDTVLRPAERALHDGDPGPRLRIWSTKEPVTVFGAWRNAVGRPAIEELFHDLGRSFSDCVSADMELVAADAIGDLAYTVAIERSNVSVNGEPRSYALRVTHVLRKENGEWRVVHRHGDTYDENRPL